MESGTIRLRWSRRCGEAPSVPGAHGHPRIDTIKIHRNQKPSGRAVTHCVPAVQICADSLYRIGCEGDISDHRNRVGAGCPHEGSAFQRDTSDGHQRFSLM